ncbi:SRPBCC family protein [Euzebya tangerina]|uniref:SRPBCC family protein n=1 Tax=Euzebya tangerina TaxID=591198 RepID=UPI0013C2D2D3|nr:SRPBCC family protein [Euzebya tangerina]
MRRQLLSICREYDRPTAAMWAVVSDLDSYADHVEALASTPVLRGSGVGAVRQCVTTSDQRWQETVTAWDDGRSYEIEVDTSTYPVVLRGVFRRFTGVWRVEPVGEDGSRVCMDFIADVRGGCLLWPLVRLAARATRKDLEATLESYGA